MELERETLSPSVDISEVEPIENILKRFGSGSMSHGALSKEAHETLAIGMNRIKGASCSGEGGEDEKRFTVDGQWRQSPTQELNKLHRQDLG